MNAARIICESDDQGVVHVDMPIGRSRQQVDVLVVWEDDDLDQDAACMGDFVGVLEGLDLERPPQGAYEERDPIA